jgi:hypothetical protein
MRLKMENNPILASVTEWFKVPDLRFLGIKPWWGNPREFEPRRWHFFYKLYSDHF